MPVKLISVAEIMENFLLFSILLLSFTTCRPCILIGSECLALSALFGPLPALTNPYHPNFLPWCSQRKGNHDPGVGMMSP